MGNLKKKKKKIDQRLLTFPPRMSISHYLIRNHLRVSDFEKKFQKKKKLKYCKNLKSIDENVLINKNVKIKINFQHIKTKKYEKRCPSW